LTPSISIDQKTTSHNPRSTVGTITEIYDYLRLLYARIGHPHCPHCKIEISKLSLDEMVDKVLDLIHSTLLNDKVKPHQFIIYSPVVRSRKGEFKDLFSNLQQKGFVQLRVDGKDMTTSDNINLIKTNKHTVDVEIDAVYCSYKEFTDDVFKANLRSRLSNALEQSINLSDGLVLIKIDEDEHLYSESFSCPECNFSIPEVEPRMFSFNSPIGACPNCKGLGTVYKIDPDQVLNPKLSINEGGIMPFAKFFFQDTWYVRMLKHVAQEEGISLDKSLEKIPQDKINILLYGTNKTYRVPGKNRYGKQTAISATFDGVATELERRYFDSSGGDNSYHEIQKYMREEICDVCEGKKLKPEVLSITIDGVNIADASQGFVKEMIDYYENTLFKKLNDYEQQIAKPILKEILIRLHFLNNVGLGYLTISRKAKTLSGGELQRIRLASQIGTGLTGVLYVLDEPSIGLHPRDVSALIKTLHDLKDLGNTLIVVEHDQETIESADYIVELGPKAGKHGGKVTFFGSKAEMLKADKCLTGKYISGKKSVDIAVDEFVKNKGTIILRGASSHNLKNLTVKFPLNNLIAITGVSGSGKSTLVVETLYPGLKYQLDGYFIEHMGDFQRLEGHHYMDRVYLVDQSPIGRTPRSNPATYVGFFDEIRDLFATTQEAKARGYGKGRFSFNVKGGRCEKCQGAGLIKIEMQFMSDMYVTCDVCKGRRYNSDTLEVLYKGKAIDQILKMTVDDAANFFKSHHRIYQKLKFLQDVGLGYIELGQPAPTFSGGEAQRIKLANELSRKGTGKTVYILDEPTTGLHFYDIEKLLHTLNKLVQKGNTVIVIEHNLDVIKHCQYIIDMGPEGGNNGGEVVYQGEIAGIIKEKKSHTGCYLKNFL
jgi:excinuclease ABC subunit A